MKFQGLPSEMHVGAADLTLLSPCQLINSCICMCCHRAGPSFLVCASDHIICPACSIPGGGEAPTFAWCPGCHRRARVTPGNIPSAAFAKLVFLCSCGFQGSLTAMREHLLDETAHDANRECSALARSPPSHPTSSYESSHIRDLCRTIAVREIERARVSSFTVGSMNELKQDMATLERDFEKKIEEINERLTVIDQNRISELEEIKDQLSKSKASITKDIAGLGTKVANQVATATKGYFWFDFEKLLKKFSEKTTTPNVTSEWQYKVIAAICFGAVLRLEKINDTDFIGVLVAPKNKIRTGFAWPVSRRITLGVIDRNGCDVMRKSYDYVYQSPQGVGAGFVQFMETQLVYSRQCLVQGKLCVTLEVGGVEA